MEDHHTLVEDLWHSTQKNAKRSLRKSNSPSKKVTSLEEMFGTTEKNAKRSLRKSNSPSKKVKLEEMFGTTGPLPYKKRPRGYSVHEKVILEHNMQPTKIVPQKQMRKGLKPRKSFRLGSTFELLKLKPTKKRNGGGKGAKLKRSKIKLAAVHAVKEVPSSDHTLKDETSVDIVRSRVKQMRISSVPLHQKRILEKIKTRHVTLEDLRDALDDQEEAFANYENIAIDLQKQNQLLAKDFYKFDDEQKTFLRDIQQAVEHRQHYTAELEQLQVTKTKIGSLKKDLVSMLLTETIRSPFIRLDLSAGLSFTISLITGGGCQG